MALNREEWHRLLDRIRANDNQLLDIDLSKKEISDSAAIEFADACICNTVIKRINLTYNKICEKGLIALAEMLKHNHTIISLRLGGNQISNTSASHFLLSLKINPVITSLSIYPKIIGEVKPNILSEISNLLEENIKCPIKSLLNIIKDNDPTITMINLNSFTRNGCRLNLFKEEFKAEFKRAINNNVYIKKLIISPCSISLLEFCPIDAYRHLHEIEIKDDNYSTMADHSRLIASQLKVALVSNKNLIRIDFPEYLFQYKKKDRILIDSLIKNNYQAYQHDKERFFTLFILVVSDSKQNPFSLLTHDLLFYLLCYILSDNIIYQQMERQKMSLPFFNKLLTPISEKNREVNTDNSMTKRFCLL